MSTPTTAVIPAARTASPAVSKAPKTVKDWINSDEFKGQIARALPKHCTPDRFLRVALTATLRTPKLMDCTPESVLSCLLQCSQIGLEPDGRRAHLIPFENRAAKTTSCTLIVDYKGLVELAMRSGLISHIHADVVRSGDLFEYNLGEITTHVPWFLRRDEYKPETFGEDVAVYAFARMRDGSSAVAVLSMDEVYSIRDNSQGWKAFKAGLTKQCPWDPENWVSEQEMKKKTAVRRLSKMLTLSPEFRDAVENEDDEPMKTAQVESVVTRPIFAKTKAAPAITEPPPTEDQIPGAEAPSVPVGTPPANDPKAPPAPAAGPISPQESLAALVTGAGFTFDQFIAWGVSTKFIHDGCGSFEEVRISRASHLVKAGDSTVAALKEFVGGAK